MFASAALGLPILSAEVSIFDGQSQAIVEDGTFVASAPLTVLIDQDQQAAQEEPPNLPSNYLQATDPIVDEPVIEKVYDKRNFVININIYKYKACHYSNSC